MKTRFHTQVICLLLVAVLMSGCSIFKKTPTPIQGRGKLMYREFPVADYSKLQIDNNQQIFYEQRPDAKPHLRIEADSNLINFITPKVEKEALTFEYAAPLDPINFRIYTNSRSLEKITLTGAGTVRVAGFTIVKDLELNIDKNANGSIFIQELQAKKLKIDIEGNGVVDVAGSASSAEYTIGSKGKGNIKAEYLKAGNLTARLLGAGTMEVNAQKSLSINLSGSGDIFYKYSGTSSNFRKKGNGIGRVEAIVTDSIQP